MDLDRIGLLKAITQRMEWLGERQRVLAENVANADTPGYKPRDLKAISFKQLVEGRETSVRPRVTQAGHLGGLAGRAGDQWASTRSRDAYEVAPDGNGVSLEQQMMKVAETQADHNLMTSLYRKQVGLLRKALGSRSGG
ncbi:flagellar basal body protein [Ferrovibrio sp.]|uniref:flagellar basal body protein n=1 Tax=Ferrovibrio sp. TaxID=1917215 RepID=UPI00311E986A